MKFFRVVSEYRWPIYIGGLLTMSVVSSGVIAWVATRPDAPRPMKNYYEQARAWDATEAVVEASRQLGWTVRYEFPADVPHVAGMPRPVDVHVADREGRPVSGLSGHFFAVRLADARFSQSGALSAVPQAPGTYRTLVLIDQPGAWDLRIDVAQDAMRFVHAARVTVPSDAPASDGGRR
jgi:hypothetical protein